MSAQNIFDRLFGSGNHRVSVDGHFVQGAAQVAGGDVAVIGTWDKAAVDGALALRIADAILTVVEGDEGRTKRPIVFIADTQGQALSRHEELLGLNGYFAHIARCVDLARRQGHRTVTVVHGEAVSGGFLSFGLLADQVFALPEAQVRVMDLRAMARVTKIPLEKLETLAQESPVFAPGAENYWRMGALEAIWSETDPWPQRLQEALAQQAGDDVRAARGLQRGGRLLAATVAERIGAA
ncbi:biotin-independent malonate decarboxylase subunit gamma [Denitratisoma sp. agr-D3]